MLCFRVLLPCVTQCCIVFCCAVLFCVTVSCVGLLCVALCCCLLWLQLTCHIFVLCCFVVYYGYSNLLYFCVVLGCAVLFCVSLCCVVLLCYVVLLCVVFTVTCHMFAYPHETSNFSQRPLSHILCIWGPPTRWLQIPLNIPAVEIESRTVVSRLLQQITLSSSSPRSAENSL